MSNDKTTTTWTPSACQGCLSNCPVLVGVRDGSVVEVKGNPASCATQGTVCRNVAMVVQQQSDPDRVLVPLRRTNPKKGRGIDPGFKPITWDEALDEIADNMMLLRKSGRSHELAVAKGRSTRLGTLLFDAVPALFGTPNKLNHDGICAQAEKLATGCMDGVWDYHDYDLEQTRYVLMWGTDPLASNRQKTRVINQFTEVKRHAHITCIDPRLSITAKRSNRWLCVVPGTDGALACALAHEILVQGLWNKRFVGDFIDGINRFVPFEHVEEATFEEQATYGLVTWWNFALKDATPQWAEPITGIPEDTIRRIAVEFASCGSKAISWISPGITMTARGLYSGMAAYALNGLVGSLGAQGGVVDFESIPKQSLPSIESFQDEIARDGLTKPAVDQRGTRVFPAAQKGTVHHGQVTNRIADALINQDPYPISMLISYWNNWAFSCTGAQRWERALETLPFFVHITTAISETTTYADIVLPAAHHMFESWGVVNTRQNLRACITLEQPCIAAAGLARSDETFVPWALAHKLADRGFRLLLDYFESFVDPVTGATPCSADDLALFAARIITEPAWRDSTQDGALREAWDEFCKVGTWNGPRATVLNELDPAYASPRFHTPSGCFEFYSRSLVSMLTAHAATCDAAIDDVMADLGYEARGSLCFLGHFEEPKRWGSDQEFPLVLSQHRSSLSLEGRSANTSYFQENKNVDPGDVAWDDVIKVHPEDMERYGLEDGCIALVSSVQGSFAVRVHAWEGTRPGVVVKCYGQGHWAYGHIAAKNVSTGQARGVNNNEIIPCDWEHISSATARHGGLARVRIEPVDCS